jgi:hypothetical protein
MQFIGREGLLVSTDEGEDSSTLKPSTYIVAKCGHNFHRSCVEKLLRWASEDVPGDVSHVSTLSASPHTGHLDTSSLADPTTPSHSLTSSVTHTHIFLCTHTFNCICLYVCSLECLDETFLLYAWGGTELCHRICVSSLHVEDDSKSGKFL